MRTKILCYIFILSFCYTKEMIEYKIKFLGIPAANCIYALSDTVIYNKKAYKINYKVESRGLYKMFYNIKNKYSIVFDKETFQILYYEKDSFQPKLVNKIKTEYAENKIIYSNNEEIKSNEINIFILLYLIGKGNLEKMNDFPIIDREGKKYSYNVEEINKSIYNLTLKEINTEDIGIIKHTDIFTWGLFLPDTKRYIYVDNYRKIIEKCVFKKGLIKIVAEKVK